MFAEVILARTSSFLDKIYHYSIPEKLKEQLKIGQPVIVPFGKREELGYVIGFVEKPDVPQVRDILRLAEGSFAFSEKTVAIARWLSNYYFSFLWTALKLFLPLGKPGVGKKVMKPVLKPEAGIPAQSPVSNIYTGILTLTPEQKSAVEAVCSAIDSGEPKKFLLYGVTGSGKTEVYLRAIAHLLAQGKSALILVPEIGMTSQLIQRVQERFSDQTVLLHSDLTDKQRREAWNRVGSGVGRIVVGTRMALFLPFVNLGLIVIDEEYETTYKSEQSPRYHAREFAFQFGVPVVLGSATPSVETFFYAEQGEIQKLVLPKRIDNRPLPPVEVVDMRNEPEFLLSGKLRLALKEVIERGEQAVLFLNRRGYYTNAICADCGQLLEWSGQGFPSACPACQGIRAKYVGLGTRRIEPEVKAEAPGARILRLDREIKEPELVLGSFARGEADVLIGTQLVTKGLDIAKVTLIGIVNADSALGHADFRAAERTFQLLTQVAGRAGRHHLPGRVIIQTYNPEHYAIQAAARHDYEMFYQEEIKFREELNYPPFTKLIAITISGKEKEKAEGEAKRLSKDLTGDFQVLGPIEAANAKVRGEWRFSILLKGEEIRVMGNGIRKALKPAKDVKITVDVEPVN